MKSNLSFVFACLIATIAFIFSCQPTENITPENPVTIAQKKGKGNGKGKNNDGGDDGGTVTPPPVAGDTYQLESASDADPLYKFTFYNSDTEVLLQTDPSITTWGTDYWGYWTDTFPYANNQVNYIVGLTNVTYDFQFLPGDKVDVTRTLIVTPYTGGSPTTTVTHPGVYSLVQ